MYICGVSRPVICCSGFCCRGQEDKGTVRVGKGLFSSDSECFLFHGIWVEVDLLFKWIFEVDLWLTSLGF